VTLQQLAMMVSALDIASIERATLSAVAPDRCDEWLGWLLPMDAGTVGRAHSAVPLSHALDTAADETIHGIIQHYQQQGYPPVLRLPETAFALHEALQQRGFRPHQTTWVQVANVADMANMANRSHADAPAWQVTVNHQPDAHWQSVFLGPGFDPVDAAARVRNLSRAKNSLYFQVLHGGQAIACGAASVSHGWLGVHGMRTAASFRRQGLAAAILREMASQAQAVGLARAFLQVDANNTSALDLYQRIGFRPAWRYAYWKVPAG
jgi:GNAT superfamily N-acetyltransferase